MLMLVARNSFGELSFYPHGLVVEVHTGITEKTCSTRRFFIQIEGRKLHGNFWSFTRYHRIETVFWVVLSMTLFF